MRRTLREAGGGPEVDFDLGVAEELMEELEDEDRDSLPFILPRKSCQFRGVRGVAGRWGRECEVLKVMVWVCRFGRGVVWGFYEMKKRNTRTCSIFTSIYTARTVHTHCI